jgi:hypothetical protein
MSQIRVGGGEAGNCWGSRYCNSGATEEVMGVRDSEVATLFGLCNKHCDKTSMMYTCSKQIKSKRVNIDDKNTVFFVLKGTTYHWIIL